MNIKENISLKKLNTFGIEADARYYSEFKNDSELMELLENKLCSNNMKLVLGGGSNILLTKDVDGFVLKNNIEGIEKIKEDDEHVYIKAGAGVNWHQFVLYCIENNLAGVENLALIPGSVGASPMQNIGAYGVEIKDVFHSLDAIHIHDIQKTMFQMIQCEFGYRESVFKHKYKNDFIITSVTYRLDKSPRFNTSYGAIEQELEKMKVEKLTIKDIAQAVMNIRRSKLPDPLLLGNAGSFFKNPEITADQFESLRISHPEIVGYKTSDNTVKVAAGWLIEKCGWKGFRLADAGVHEKQALVLVNYGNARGSELLELAEKITQSVNEQFGIMLTREVNIY